MKNYVIIIILSCVLINCNNKPDKQKLTEKEKSELKKVESLKKTDKQKEDSVLAMWQQKMGNLKIGGK